MHLNYSAFGKFSDPFDFLHILLCCSLLLKLFKFVFSRLSLCSVLMKPRLNFLFCKPLGLEETSVNAHVSHRDMLRVRQNTPGEFGSSWQRIWPLQMEMTHSSPFAYRARRWDPITSGHLRCVVIESPQTNVNATVYLCCTGINFKPNPQPWAQPINPYSKLYVFFFF